MDGVRVIAFDADDTLWDCQTFFERVQDRLYEIIAPWTMDSASELIATERANMSLLGYGSKAFTLSVIETALRVSGGKIETSKIQELLQLGKSLLNIPARPLPEVTSTLRRLRESLPQSVRLVVFTKGELQDQENKLRRSGLLPFFSHVEITSDKTQHEYRSLCHKLDVHPSELVMVGNSMKSDVAPALAIGARAVYLPFYVTWELEHAEDLDHERLTRIGHFRELLPLFGC